VIFPLGVALLLFYLDWGVSALKRLSTDFVLATNQPLRQLLMDCADPEHLRSRRAPVLVTLATIGGGGARYPDGAGREPSETGSSLTQSIAREAEPESHCPLVADPRDW
jgi:hypothetical protein